MVELNKEQLTLTSLEGMIGASKGVITRAAKSGSDIQSKWLLKLLELFSDKYSLDWLITGNGNPYKDDGSSQVIAQKIISENIQLKKDLDECKSEIDILKDQIVQAHRQQLSYNNLVAELTAEYKNKRNS